MYGSFTQNSRPIPRLIPVAWMDGIGWYDWAISLNKSDLSNIPRHCNYLIKKMSINIFCLLQCNNVSRYTQFYHDRKYAKDTISIKLLKFNGTFVTLSIIQSPSFVTDDCDFTSIRLIHRPSEQLSEHYYYLSQMLLMSLSMFYFQFSFLWFLAKP